MKREEGTTKEKELVEEKKTKDGDEETGWKDETEEDREKMARIRETARELRREETARELDEIPEGTERRGNGGKIGEEDGDTRKEGAKKVSFREKIQEVSEIEAEGLMMRTPKNWRNERRWGKEKENMGKEGEGGETGDSSELDRRTWLGYILGMKRDKEQDERE